MGKNNDNQAHVAHPELDDVLKIPFNGITINWNNKIGEGGFSLIYLGVWNGQRVAVKQLKHFVEKEEILNEAKVLSSLRHSHIVSLIGVTIDPSNDETMLVLELAENGSLDKLLRNQGALDKSRAIHIALDIAQGISYLHSRKIIHRDLKCENVLLYEESSRAKLADLGAARILTKKSKVSSTVGTKGFMAPEILHEETYGTSADVYSFGAVMHQMITNKGFPVLFKDDNQMMDKIEANVTDKQFRDLITVCCWKTPEHCPPIHKCIEKLQIMLATLNDPTKDEDSFVNQFPSSPSPTIHNPREKHVQVPHPSQFDATRQGTVHYHPSHLLQPQLEPHYTTQTSQNQLDFLASISARTGSSQFYSPVKNLTYQSHLLFPLQSHYFPSEFGPPPQSHYFGPPQQAKNPVLALIQKLQHENLTPAQQINILQDEVSDLPPITSADVRSIVLAFASEHYFALKLLFSKVTDPQNFVSLLEMISDPTERDKLRQELVFNKL